MKKRFPDNQHMNNYADWVYLGSDRKHDYYYKNNVGGVILGGDHLLSIVYGKEPWEYLSPDLSFLTQPHVPHYRKLRELLLAKNLLPEEYV